MKGRLIRAHMTRSKTISCKGQTTDTFGPLAEAPLVWCKGLAGIHWFGLTEVPRVNPNLNEWN